MDNRLLTAITGLKDSFQAWKEKTQEVGEKFEILIDILTELKIGEKEDV